VNKKAQVAMEFLMTYGWAILVILIVIAVIISTGIFNPKIPNTCASISPVTCYDVKLDTSGTIFFTLTSSDTESALINQVTLNNPSIIPGTCTVQTNNIQNDIIQTFSCDLLGTGTLQEGIRFDATVSITYILLGGTNSHDISIKLSGTTE